MSNHAKQGFAALKVVPELCQLLLKHQIETPTPIQAQAIPIAMDGRDLIGIAQTGTGKTLAFGLPIAQQLKQGEIGLVLAPTRELAQQIAETFQKLHIDTVLVIGGAAMNRQVHQLRGRYSVIVATPGRLIDHLQQRTVRLDRVSKLVLDEADRMLDMGFAPAIKRILEQTPKARQTMLFSATMPREIIDLANTYLRDPKRIEVDPPGMAAELVEQELYYIAHEEKQPVLAALLHEHPGPVLVFARTRHGARKLARNVRTHGHTASEIHSDRTLAQRREALQGFKDGEYKVLVATDIAARGIDVKEIALVVNYDVPTNPEDYIHRIGRTGRAGIKGKAITLAVPEQFGEVRDIEKLLGTAFNVSDRSTSVPYAMRKGVRNKPGAFGQNQSAPLFAKAVTAAAGARPTESHDSLRAPRRQAEQPASAPTHVQSTVRKGHRGWSGRPKRGR